MHTRAITKKKTNEKYRISSKMGSYSMLRQEFRLKNNDGILKITKNLSFVLKFPSLNSSKLINKHKSPFYLLG